MATQLNQACDRCPTTVQWDPNKDKQYRYVVDDSTVADADTPTLARSGALRGADIDERRGTRTIILPADWGVLELNVGHEKQVQEICPACVGLLRSFLTDTDRQLPEKADATEPKKLEGKGTLIYISPREHHRLVRLAGESAFVRGYCVATAMVAHEGRQTGVEEMIRAANITPELMKRSGVDDFDAEPILAVLKKMRARERSARAIERPRSPKRMPSTKASSRPPKPRRPRSR